MKLGAVRIFVLDIVEAKRFYSETLGLAVESYDEEHGFCMFDTGPTKLIVEVPDGSDEGHGPLTGRFTGLSFPVADILAKHRELVAAHVTFSGEPELQYWGGWLATFKDPSGTSCNSCSNRRRSGGFARG